MLFKIVFSFLLIVNIASSGAAVTGLEYFSVPPVFHLDDYDRCMLLEDQALYCSISFELEPSDIKNVSETWNIIERLISNPKNYRHDHLRHGICVPETCGNITRRAENDPVLIQHITNCYNTKYKNLGIKGHISEIHCLIPESYYPIDSYDIVVMVCICGYMLFVIFATVYERVARHKRPEKYEKIIRTPYGSLLAAFSITKNWKRLTKIKTDPDSEKLAAMQGVKFYNMICVILSHTIMSSLASPIMNPLYTETITDQILNMFLANGGYAVQTFFLISGWLLSYHFFILFERKSSFSIKYIFLAFLNRYIRLTPILLVVLSIHSTWLIHLGNGPVWQKIIGTEYKNCRNNWWTNLLYINNYVNKENMCMQQSWYIAADTQLFIVSLIILSLVWIYQRKVKAILGITLAIGILIPGIVSFVTKSDIVTRQYPEPLYELLLKIENWHQLYSSGYSNLGGYAIGLCFGYIYYNYRNEKIKITKIHILLWWILSFGCCIFIILIAGIMYRDDYTYTRFEAAAYWSFGKNIFAFGIAVGIYGITQNIGWPAKNVLESAPAQIMGRLTYSTYIIHVAFAKYRVGTLRTPLYMSNYFIFFTSLSDMVLAYIAGTVLCLAFEMPISALQKIFVPQLSTKRQQDYSEKSLKTVDYCEEELQTKM